MKKPPEQVREEFVRQWLLKAEEDLQAAKFLLPHGETFLSTVCFHSQQAAEKYLKAFLIRHQVEFPKTHDIGELLDLIHPVDRDLSDALRDTVVLPDYGVDVRYLSDSPSVTVRDAQQAVQLAEKVRRSILKLL
ncbi:MAG: HEPN domain-containing protein [Planctomycetes bacterium]|nr:HEPN domain-containing protein [Planctomycetota bacterium]